MKHTHTPVFPHIAARPSGKAAYVLHDIHLVHLTAERNRSVNARANRLVEARESACNSTSKARGRATAQCGKTLTHCSAKAGTSEEAVVESLEWGGGAGAGALSFDTCDLKHGRARCCVWKWRVSGGLVERELGV